VGGVVPLKLLRRSKSHLPAASAATRPNKPAKRPDDASIVYRAVEGSPIHWRDRNGTVHACEVTKVDPGCCMLAWTICGTDVNHRATYVSRDPDEVSCPVCAVERRVPPGPHGAPFLQFLHFLHRI
jgi:hypothetical protein